VLSSGVAAGALIWCNMVKERKERMRARVSLDTGAAILFARDNCVAVRLDSMVDSDRTKGKPSGRDIFSWA
jgi:hypothetical protein